MDNHEKKDSKKSPIYQFRLLVTGIRLLHCVKWGHWKMHGENLKIFLHKTEDDDVGSFWKPAGDDEESNNSDTIVIGQCRATR